MEMPPALPLGSKRVATPKFPYLAPKYARQVVERAEASADAKVAKNKALLGKGFSVAPTTPWKAAKAGAVFIKGATAAVKPKTAPRVIASPAQLAALTVPTFDVASGKSGRKFDLSGCRPASPRPDRSEESPPPTPPASKATRARSPVAPAPSEATAARSPVAPDPAPASSSLSGSAKSASARPCSSRKNDKGVALSHAALLVVVRELNSRTDKAFQLKNLRQQSLLQLDAWLDLQHERAATASVAAQIKAHAVRLTQPVHRDVCMRMLMLLATQPVLLALYQDSCAGTSRIQLDAGSKPGVNSGQGMGLNHQYWEMMADMFNDISIVSDFPFDYFVPPEMVVIHSDAVTTVPTPPAIEGGLFAGLGLKQPRLPEGFPDGFFDIATLDKIFTAGLNEYHNATSRFHQSGQHGRPIWFFVSPTKTVKPEEQAEYLHLAVKRWDSLAFHLLFEQVLELHKIFTKAIPGGKGGPPCDTSGDLPAGVPAGSSGRVAAAHKMLKFEELHSLQVSALKDKQRAREIAGDTSTLSKIRDSMKLMLDFEIMKDADMVAQCKNNISALKATLPHMHALTVGALMPPTPAASASNLDLHCIESNPAPHAP
jgi:hypothetical protein